MDISCLNDHSFCEDEELCIKFKAESTDLGKNENLGTLSGSICALEEDTGCDSEDYDKKSTLEYANARFKLVVTYTCEEYKRSTHPMLIIGPILGVLVCIAVAWIGKMNYERENGPCFGGEKPVREPRPVEVSEEQPMKMPTPVVPNN